MPCNCGKKKPTSYTYTSADGKTTSYTTEVEAKAAQIKAGGTGQIRVVSR